MVPCAHAKIPPAHAPAAPAVRALLVSDIHFDPFWDPAKAAKLAAAPASNWSAILDAPDSPGRGLRFTRLQLGCGAKGVDTSYPLLKSSLAAMRADAAGAAFLTLSGDLVAHNFDCKYHAMFPRASHSDYRMFMVKTIEFVQLELHRAMPGAAIFTALGNNDSDCGDYRLDAYSAFLAAAGPVIGADLGLTGARRRRAQSTFAAGGYYRAPLPAPLRNARILVLDDVFMSSQYQTCAGHPDREPAAAQIRWLRDQLTTARRDHKSIWVMAHIPPGIDVYTTARSLRRVCSGEKADTFLSSDALAGTLSEFGDVVRLAIFAHTHMDELRLIEPAGGASARHPAIAVKMVGSISPVDGNRPSFTVAQVNPRTATLSDYQVYAASNRTGIGTAWTREYDFDNAYGQPAFTAAALSNLIAGFRADRAARTAPSRSYLRDYFAGDLTPLLKPFWPQYVCALRNRTPASYRECVCAPRQ